MLVSRTEPTARSSEKAETIVLPRAVVRVHIDDVPDAVLGFLNEAAACETHGLYYAAAMMYRRALEQICIDRSATGANLEQRIDALCASHGLDDLVRQAMHDVRQYGNDAAHSVKSFKEIGTAEAEAARLVLQHIAHHVYARSRELRRLAELKRPPAADPT